MEVEEGPSQPEGALVGCTLGPYDVQRLLGRGGMGEVYLAEDRRLGRQIALKILPPALAADPGRRARFEREGQAGAVLNHPNICNTHEVGEADGHPFIAMEYVEGMSLKERLAGPPLTVDEVLDIGLQVTDALNEARQKQIVHRDLKSANIILTPRHQVKVLDFGLAKQLAEHPEGAPTATGLTDAGVVLGTADYMSPEQALSQPVDHRSDIFSFGVVLYELLTGRLPFTGDSSPALLNTIVNQDPPPIPRYNDAVPDPLVRVVRKMLEKDRERRYQSVHEVWSDLRRLREESASQEIAPEPARRPAWGVWAAGLLITLTAGGLGVALWPSSTSVTDDVRANSVVALPAQVFGAPGFAYLTDAVPTALSTQLAGVEGLETKLPPTSFQVAAADGDVNRIADAFGVEALITSTLTAQTDELVLNVQLVEPTTLRVLWSREYDGDPTTYLDLIREAAGELRLALRPDATTVAPAASLASRPDAELAFQRGRYYANRYNDLHEPADFATALAALEQALAVDPDFAAAAAEIAWLYMYRTEAGLPVEEATADIAAWANRALAIDQESSRALLALAALEELHGSMSWRKGLGYVLRAEALDPRDASAAFGLGRLMLSCKAGVAAYAEARRRDPLYLPAAHYQAGSLSCLDRPQEALALLDRVLTSQPEFTYGLLGRFFLLVGLGRLEEATQALDAVKEGRLPEDILLMGEVSLAVARGDATAQDLASRLATVVADPTTPATYLQGAIWLVPILASHGKADLALQTIERSVAAGVLPYDFLRLNRHLGSLRSEPGFKDALDRAEDQSLEILRILEDAPRATSSPRSWNSHSQNFVPTWNSNPRRSRGAVETQHPTDAGGRVGPSPRWNRPDPVPQT